MVVAGFEAFGNCRFSHWGRDGEPVGEPHPDPSVVIAAVSEDQAKVTLKTGRWLFSPAMRSEFGVDVGKEAITGLHGRAEIKVLSASFRSAEGKPTSFAIENETHHWVTGNNGTDLHDTIEGNVAKGSGGQSRRLMISNAYLPGEDSVLERTRDAYETQMEKREKHPDWLDDEDAGIYYDSLEADPRVPMLPEELRKVLPEIRGDSVWLSVRSFMRSIMNKSRTVERSRRLYLNQIVSAQDGLFDSADIKACTDASLPLRDGDQIVLGFDGARTRDATAVVACRVSDRKVFLLGLWEKPSVDIDPDWVLDSGLVDSVVQEAFRRFNVLAFYADVNKWEAEINRWSDQFRDRLVLRASPNSAVGWDMRGGQRKITMTNENIIASVQHQEFRLDDDGALRRHFLNVRRRSNNFGVSFGKESHDSPKKIDAYAASLLAFMAAIDVAEKGKIPKPKKSRRLMRR